MTQEPAGTDDPNSGSTPDIDYRFTLANERTLLAWLRTSLALIAGGLGVETFATTLEPKWLPALIGIVAIIIGAILAVIGYSHWNRSEAAMVDGRPLPRPRAAPIVTVGIVIVATGLIIGILI